MRIGITGTYSSGKTTTAMALSHLTGIPRTDAPTMRELLPFAAPGKKLSECTSAEYVQLVVRRHCSRAVHEALLGSDFISDGCSLQEWSYGTSRVAFGMNPTEDDRRDRPLGDVTAHDFYGDVFTQLGLAFADHVRSSFDAFVHLENELSIVNDGHRPMNDDFRTRADELVLDQLRRSGLPIITVRGSLSDRITQIIDQLELPVRTSVEEAISAAHAEYAQLDQRLELTRQR